MQLPRSTEGRRSGCTGRKEGSGLGSAGLWKVEGYIGQVQRRSTLELRRLTGRRMRFAIIREGRLGAGLKKVNASIKGWR